mmetsp:Transcript_93782/g.242318  ORF Transcript_93782/g.242318 Transcript_93782/m.242318 type:complete len:228 (-) Transcript_93782:84-767(-)
MIRAADIGEPVRVKMHPSSVSTQETNLTSPYLVYQELVNTTQLYVRDITPVPPLALVLFGGALDRDKARTMALGDAVITVDGWIKLAVPARVREPLLETRRRLDAHLASWVDRGTDTAQRGGAELLDAIVTLLSIQTETQATESAPAQHAGQPKWKGGGGGKKWPGAGGGSKALQKAHGAFANFGGGSGSKRPSPSITNFRGTAAGSMKRAAPSSNVPAAFAKRLKR